MRMKRISFILLLVCTHAHAVSIKDAANPKGIGETLKGINTRSENKAERQALELYPGIQRTFDLTFEPCSKTEECIRVGNKMLFETQYSSQKKQLIFTPVKEGETTVVIRNDKGDIKLILDVVVSKSNLARRASELKELLKDIEGIQIKILSDKILVDGEVIVLGDLNRLYAVLSDPSYKDFVLPLVGVSPIGMQMMADKMQAEINKPNVRVRIVNNLFQVEGQVDNANEAESVLNIARRMLQGYVLPTYSLEGPRNLYEVRRNAPSKDGPVVARLTIAPPKAPPAPKMLRITIDFVELSKDYLRNFGFSWIPSLDTGGGVSFGQSTTGGVTSEGSGSLSGTIGNLFPKLNAAQNAGYARILEESVLIVKAGQKASFARQFEIPIQTVNDRGQPVFNKVPVGPEITVTPKVSGESEDVDMDIQFGYVGLAGKQGNAPITLNHKYRAGSVIVRSGESAAIVNALSNVISTSFNKDQPTGTAPANPLFTLLRSKAFQKSKSQFVVFLTPQIMESSSGGTQDIKSKYGLKERK